MVAQDLVPETLRSYRGQIQAFVKHVDAANFLKIGDTELQTYLATLRRAKRAASTVNGHFCALASFYGYLEHRGIVTKDPVPNFRRFYLKNTRSKAKRQRARRQSIDPERAAAFLVSIGDIQTRAMVATLLKTGIRREELSGINMEDIDWHNLEIEISLHPKRSQGTVCFDDELARLLRRWLSIRRLYADPESGPLFVNSHGRRMGRNGIYARFVAAAQANGLHDPNGPTHRRFTPHCARHCFTRWLRKTGMPDHVIAHLRGDAESSMVDVYDQLDPEDVRTTYRAYMPRLGVA